MVGSVVVPGPLRSTPGRAAHPAGARRPSPFADASPASSALVCGITGITAWAALPPLQLITPWPPARRALRATVSILSIGAGAAALGLLHGIGLTTQRTALWDYLLSATLPATALIFLGVSGIATLLRTAATPR